MADETTGESRLEKFKSYLTTRKGMTMVAEILLCLVILICFAASHYGGYLVLAICELVFAVVFLVVFALRLDQQFKVVSWVWSDFLRALVGAVLFLITSLISVIGGGDRARIAGGVILFSYDSYLGCLSIKSSKAAATGERIAR
ncbi:proteolipid protein 2-like [Acipenser oxyrinchus oxyrinchus]|uniref:Proteolipid protein 2 n=1 Tax=Acipenser oxyrinchus oxyrinchus TaxID=40147 RepID=A0AAD8FNY1_ACIOX|nr:proteolipid protein 2-like [Acipenser oxyrinchus oxyrinchus]